MEAIIALASHDEKCKKHHNMPRANLSSRDADT